MERSYLSLVFLIYSCIWVAGQAYFGDAAPFLKEWKNVLSDVPILHQQGFNRGADTEECYYAFFPSMRGYEDAPLLIWIKDPRDQASAMGMFSTGPFSIQEERIFKNDNSLNDAFNLLYYELPVGIGFTKTDAKSFLKEIDEVADYMVDRLEKFVQEIPFITSHQVFLAGEMKAVNIVAKMAAKIVKKKEYGNANYPIKLEGVIFDSPEVDKRNTGPGGKSLLYDMLLERYLSGTLTEEQFKYVSDLCGDYLHNRNLPLSNECYKAFVNRTEFVYYNLISTADFCPLWQHGISPVRGQTLEYDCKKDSHAALYMQKLFPTMIFRNAGIAEVEYDNQFEVDFETLKVNNIRSLFLSGDLDLVSTYRSTEKWINLIGGNIGDDWIPWTTDSNGDVAGFYSTYSNKLVTHATVHGASHKVYDHNPRALRVLITSWALNARLPSMDPRASVPKPI